MTDYEVDYISAENEWAIGQELDEAYADDATRTKLALTQISSASVSFLASSCIVVMIWKSSTGLSSSPYKRIIFALSLSDVLSSLAMLTGPFALPRTAHQGIVGFVAGTTGTCAANGLAMVFGFTAVPMYTYLLCYYYYCKLKKNMADATFHLKVERHAHIGIVLWNVGVCLAGIVTSSFNGEPEGYGCTFSTYPAGCLEFEEEVGACQRGAHSRFLGILSLFLVPFLSCIAVFIISAMISCHAIQIGHNYQHEKGQRQQQYQRRNKARRPQNNEHDYSDDGKDDDDDDDSNNNSGELSPKMTSITSIDLDKNKKNEKTRSHQDDKDENTHNHEPSEEFKNGSNLTDTTITTMAASTATRSINRDNTKNSNTTSSHQDENQDEEENKNKTKNGHDNDDNDESNEDIKNRSKVFETSITTMTASYSRPSLSVAGDSDKDNNSNAMRLQLRNTEQVEEDAVRLYRRETILQALLYAFSFFLVHFSVFAHYFLVIFGVMRPLFMRYSFRLLYPMGGVLNIMVWTRPKVVQLKQRYPEYSSIEALYFILQAGGEIPDLSNHRKYKNKNKTTTNTNRWWCCCFPSFSSSSSSLIASNDDEGEKNHVSQQQAKKERKESLEGDNNNDKAAAAVVVESADLRAQQSLDNLRVSNMSGVCGVSEASVGHNAVVWSKVNLGGGTNKKEKLAKNKKKWKQPRKDLGVLISGW